MKQGSNPTMFEELIRLLDRGDLPAVSHPAESIRIRSLKITMRDGVHIAADLYLPPEDAAPAVIMLSPYGKALDGFVGMFLSFARRGYVVVSADCRGTGESEPDHWDYYMYEAEDGFDLVQWVTQQSWYDGFIGSCGGSYIGQTQWCMATHPAMSAIAPQVSGLGLAVNTARLYMFLNAYSYVMRKGQDRISIFDMEKHFEAETMANGFFNEAIEGALPPSIVEAFPELANLSPARAKSWLWTHYASLPSAGRAALVKRALNVEHITSHDVEGLASIFGHRISHDAHTLPYVDKDQLCHTVAAPPLMITGWYDWGLNDALATWTGIQRSGKSDVAERARLIIGPQSHHATGYREGVEKSPSLLRLPTTPNYAGLLMRWYSSIARDDVDTWPRVVYYLMGAGEWRAANEWPPTDADRLALFLRTNGRLTRESPDDDPPPDRFVYDPLEPTPTIGGSIVSFLLPAGSVDVTEAQRRDDVLVYTSDPLEQDLDVVGPIAAMLYVSSSAVDTDFVVRLSDVFPDGRAIQIQSGILRTRYREIDQNPSLLKPGAVYRLEIDVWATANRFAAGHCIRIDISSADFPHYDRNSNRGGDAGEPTPALQMIYVDRERSSRIILPILAPAQMHSDRRK
jgi:predicted acyl esterase